MKKIIEICCGSYEDAYIAKEAGADQIELNSSLFLGGLTPSIGMVKLVKELKIPIMAMVRPRGAGFYYNLFEFENILKDVEELLNQDIDGIVFGCLTDDKKIDLDKNREIIKLIKSKRKLAIFHRAFDQTTDPYRAMEELIELGVNRVLTSGQKSNAIDGVALLNDLELKYGNDIEILIGSGVNSQNINEIYNKTNIKRFHSSCKAWRVDPTTIGNVSYEYGVNENNSSYEVTDLDTAKAFVKTINSL